MWTLFSMSTGVIKQIQCKHKRNRIRIETKHKMPNAIAIREKLDDLVQHYESTTILVNIL